MPKLLRLSDGAVIDLAPPAEIEIGHDTDLMTEPPRLEGVRSVRVTLPKFKDGRAFTQVRLLRQRHGFSGDIHVGGHVLPDQALFLARLGASAVELESDARLGDFRSALRAYRYAYQRPVEAGPALITRGASA